MLSLIAKETEEESKHYTFQVDRNIIKANLSIIPKIYSLKVHLNSDQLSG